MRALRLAALIFALTFQACLPSLLAGQANWTPNLDEHSRQRAEQSSPLSQYRVDVITLSPEEARKHYNIDIPSAQQFVKVVSAPAPPPAWATPSYCLPPCRPQEVPPARGSNGYGWIQSEDLVDAVIVGGEIPQHGQIKTVADFDRYKLLCLPGCLVFVRHKDWGSMSDITKQGEVYPKLFSGDGKHVCDPKTNYVYNIDFAVMPGYESENWFPPSEYPRLCRVGISPSELSSAQSGPSVEQEIAAIRNAPHEAMPQAQPARASLGGQTSMTVKNDTNYVLDLYLSGPSSQKLEIAAGDSQTLRLPPGHYEIAGKVSNPSVVPFYGTEDYAANTGYSSHFYIATQPR